MSQKSEEPKEQEEEEEKTCECGGSTNRGDCIMCDNFDHCRYGWYHYKCQGVLKSNVPRGKWYCTYCRVLPNFSRYRINGRLPTDYGINQFTNRNNPRPVPEQGSSKGSSKRSGSGKGPSKKSSK